MLDFQKYLQTEDIQKLHAMKLDLDDKYYNKGESPLDDTHYDMLKDTLKKRDPYYTPPVGAKIRRGENRVKLPFWLGSIDKITPKEPDALNRWLRDNKADVYIVSDKLDGVSCLLERKNGIIKLYTRGDGLIGADISYLTGYFKTIPKNLSNDILVRGELIIPKNIFLRKYNGKTVNNRVYKNARNMVAGLLGGKTVRHGLEDIDFVTYEIVGDNMPKPSQQLDTLYRLGFTVVTHERVTELTIENLSKRYLQDSPYDVDGVVVQGDKPYDRNIDGNPDYIFAFKMLLESAIRQAVVKDVEWNISKWGQLKPVVIIDPVHLEDITITRVTAHNAKYIEKNKLAPGAVINITRSKDVIPYIVNVVQMAQEAKMPNTPYMWDSNHVNIMVEKTEDIMCVKLISSFFAKLGIKHVSEATIEKMFANGLNNLIKIISASEERLAQVPEFHDRTVQRIYVGIRNGLTDVDISTVIGASGVLGFGIGKKRMDSLFLHIPNVLHLYKTMSQPQLIDLISTVDGFSYVMAEKIAYNLHYADIFVTKLRKYATFKEKIRVSDSMKGHKYVMTGFRDKKLEQYISERGGKITTTVSKNTTAVITSLKKTPTDKINKANKLGIPIYKKDDFMIKYELNYF